MKKIIDTIIYTTESEDAAVKRSFSEGTYSSKMCTVKIHNGDHPYRLSAKGIKDLELICSPIMETDPTLNLFSKKWKQQGVADVFDFMQKMCTFGKNNIINFLFQADIRDEKILNLITGSQMEVFLLETSHSPLYLFEIIPEIKGYNSDTFVGSKFKGPLLMPSFASGKELAGFNEVFGDISHFAQLALIERMSQIAQQANPGSTLTLQQMYSKDNEQKAHAEWKSDQTLWVITDPRYVLIYLVNFMIGLTLPHGTFVAESSNNPEIRN